MKYKGKFKSKSKSKMRTFLYIVWFLIPTFFFVMALWGFLEQVGNKQKRENVGDFMKQGAFVLACVLLCVFLDQFVLEDSIWPLVMEWVPLGFLQIVLLPVVLLVAAKLVGGSTPILISKAPKPSKRGKK